MSSGVHSLNTSPDSQSRERTRISPSHSLGYLLATWLRQSYDELGKLTLGNALLLVAVTLGLSPAYFLGEAIQEGTPFFPIGLVFVTLGLAGAWLVLSVWFALNVFLENLFTFQYPGWGEVRRGFKRHAVTSLRTLAFLGGGVGILAFNFWTYPAMLSEEPALRFLALGLTLWIGLFLAMVQVHLIPFLVHQDRSFFTALRRAAMVAVWKPFRTLTILLIQILFVMLYFVPPFFLIVPGLYAVLSNLSLLILLEDWKDPYEKTSEAIRAGV